MKKSIFIFFFSTFLSVSIFGQVSYSQVVMPRPKIQQRPNLAFKTPNYTIDMSHRLALPKDPGIYTTGLGLYKDQVQTRSTSSVTFRPKTSLDAEVEPNINMVPSRLDLFMERILPAEWRGVNIPLLPAEWRGGNVPPWRN